MVGLVVGAEVGLRLDWVDIGGLDGITVVGTTVGSEEEGEMVGENVNGALEGLKEASANSPRFGP